MDWWLGLLAFALAVGCTAEVLCAFEITGNPVTIVLSVFHELWSLLPW
jgi:hypothetical protein